MNGELASVGRYRAIMTTTDREYISGEADVDDAKRNQSVSRVRDRLNELKKDLELLEKHHPELYEEAREVVCSDE